MRLFLCVAMIGTTIACGSSPTAPTPPPQPPNIQGQWTGPYSVSSCTTTGAATGSGFCPSLGSGGSMIFTPQQNGTQVSGTLTVGALQLPVTGSVDTAGVVVLSGSTTLFAGAVLTMQTWRGTVSGSTLAGSYQFSIVDVSGSATVIGGFTLTK